MTTKLDGPRLAPAAGGAAKQLVVFVHGYGADGSDLIGLGRQWAKHLPHTAFASPDAPEQCPGSPGFQWFPLIQRDMAEFTAGVATAAPFLEAFIDAELERLQLQPAALALVGFSQGTMVALHIGLCGKIAPKAIVGYSGALAGAETLPANIKTRPKVLLVHGARDEVIPIAALAHARQGLTAANVPFQWYVSPDIGHGIAPDGLALGAKFLEKNLLR
ncbi:Phospholipase/carboxylesterase family protein [hydrothermal vent metagenome]|uniref:Phospholipase/carboxylesterase family protein n=1 Tax=hydrothermal vent metagenome TaxID=652676 RepID=A0A3B0T5Q0_9ZZZZ